jgi:hypothetical protein
MFSRTDKTRTVSLTQVPACVATKSSFVKLCDASNTRFAYSLPKTQVLVTAARREAVPSDPLTNVARAEDEVFNGQKYINTAKAILAAVPPNKNKVSVDRKFLDLVIAAFAAAPKRFAASQLALQKSGAVADAQRIASRVSAAVATGAAQVTTAQTSLTTNFGKKRPVRKFCLGRSLHRSATGAIAPRTL